MIIICIIILIYAVLNLLNLQWGGVASDAQLSGKLQISKTEQTGPSRNYWQESWEVVRANAAKQDPRIKKDDVQQELMPDRYKIFYKGVNDYRVGYLGSGRFQLFFKYVVHEGHKIKQVAGYGMVRVDQQKIGIFVRQNFVVEKYVITFRE